LFEKEEGEDLPGSETQTSIAGDGSENPPTAITAVTEIGFLEGGP
jgi:hypothetical protein